MAAHAWHISEKLPLLPIVTGRIKNISFLLIHNN